MGLANTPYEPSEVFSRLQRFFVGGGDLRLYPPLALSTSVVSYEDSSTHEARKQHSLVGPSCLVSFGSRILLTKGWTDAYCS